MKNMVGFLYRNHFIYKQKFTKPPKREIGRGLKIDGMDIDEVNSFVYDYAVEEKYE